MFPAGEEGEGLDNGFHVAGMLGYEMNPGLHLGGTLAYTSSPDTLHTQFLIADGFIRMSPSADLPRFYLQIGLGLYSLHYDPEPGAAAPEDRIRPGGNFGAGFDITTTPPWFIGVLASYHGVVAGKQDAVGYATVGLYVSFRPGIF
jgi:hypothetical protein